MLRAFQYNTLVTLMLRKNWPIHLAFLLTFLSYLYIYAVVKGIHKGPIGKIIFDNMTLEKEQ